MSKKWFHYLIYIGSIFLFFSQSYCTIWSNFFYNPLWVDEFGWQIWTCNISSNIINFWFIKDGWNYRHTAQSQTTPEERCSDRETDQQKLSHLHLCLWNNSIAVGNEFYTVNQHKSQPVFDHPQEHRGMVTQTSTYSTFTFPQTALQIGPFYN